MDPAGHLEAIVEATDATEEQRQIKLCNGGFMLVDAAKLWLLLDKLTPANTKGEFYLTDCVRLARAAGYPCALVDLGAEDVLGVNTRLDLAQVEDIMQQRLRRNVMFNGATLRDPSTVWLAADTKLGRDVLVEPHVVFGPGVTVGDGTEIRSFCYLEQTAIGANAIVGPFARLRPHTILGANARIGNFVELKNATLGDGVKINHLSYIGDAFVGDGANIGAGTITCNYDGFRKTYTHIGAEAFIGSNTALVAPVKIGDGAYVGAGSVITMDVPPNTLAVARGRQANIDDGARRYREQPKRDTSET